MKIRCKYIDLNTMQEGSVFYDKDGYGLTQVEAIKILKELLAKDILIIDLVMDQL